MGLKSALSIWFDRNNEIVHIESGTCPMHDKKVTIKILIIVYKLELYSSLYNFIVKACDLMYKSTLR